MPKEKYPFTRLRLSELFQKELTKLNIKIFWIAQNSNSINKDVKFIKGNNKYYLIKSFSNDMIIKNFFDRLYSLKKIYILYKVLKKEKNIEILIANDGIIEGLICLLFKIIKKKPFCFYLSGLFYEIDKNEYKLNKDLKSFILFYFSYVKEPLYKIIIYNSDIFHPITSKMSSYFLKKNDKRLDILPLPLCPSSFFFKYKPDNNNNKTLLYVGKINYSRKLEILLDILNIIVNKKYLKDTKLIIIGKLSTKEIKDKLILKAKKMNILMNLRIYDEVSISEVPIIISKSNIGLSILPPISAYKVSSPTKVVEYLSVGIPVVVNSEIDDQDFIVNKSKGGYSVKYDINLLADKIYYLLKNPNKANEMGLKGKNWILKNRNYKILATKLKKKYKIKIENKGRNKL